MGFENAAAGCAFLAVSCSIYVPIGAALTFIRYREPQHAVISTMADLVKLIAGAIRRSVRRQVCDVLTP
jgi:hypothetical protein